MPRDLETTTEGTIEIAIALIDETVVAVVAEMNIGVIGDEAMTGEMIGTLTDVRVIGIGTGDEMVGEMMGEGMVVIEGATTETATATASPKRRRRRGLRRLQLRPTAKQ